MSGLVALTGCPDHSRSCSTVSPLAEAFNSLGPVTDDAPIGCTTSIHGTKHVNFYHNLLFVTQVHTRYAVNSLIYKGTVIFLKLRYP